MHMCSAEEENIEMGFEWVNGDSNFIFVRTITLSLSHNTHTHTHTHTHTIQIRPINNRLETKFRLDTWDINNKKHK